MSNQSFLNEDQKEILKEIRDASYVTLNGKDKNGIPFLKHIFDLHYKIFGETCSNCPNKIGGYIQKLKKFNPELKMEIVKSNFELNDGVIIPITGTSDVYSKHNLTDEAALKILAKNPNRRSLFRVVPDDLDELIDDYLEALEVNQEDQNTDDDQDDDDDDDNQDDDDSENDDDQEDQNTDDDQELVLIGESKFTIEEALSLLELINVTTKASTVTGIKKTISKLSEENKLELQNLAADLITKQ
ncbi:hypothetical protein EV143_1189 [Flavobacterium chryseum]|uniref:hypothetical protein n=1 Tax=Flavobacterium sp. P3160 TaxID=2512113 RepID=UPI00105E3DD5|nr:hypothetical protein [Flavobacterium sp. P3160]TDO68825.1 hypothetical protein EV143_1189 [Flavobacterium sp. P3160]